MAAKYPVYLGVVTLTSSNNAILFNEGAGDLTATIPAGDYFLRGDGVTVAPKDLAIAIQTALDNAAVSHAYAVSVSFDIDKDNPTATVTISADGAFTLKWADASTTFDEGLLGFADANTSSATSHSSTLSPSCVWLPDQPVESKEPGESREVSQHLTPEGQTYTFVRSDVLDTRTVQHSLVAAERSKKESNTSDENATFDAFWRTYSSGKRVELHSSELSSGTTLSALSSSTLLNTYVFDQDTCQRVPRTRYSPATARYSWSVGLRRYVA